MGRTPADRIDFSEQLDSLRPARIPASQAATKQAREHRSQEDRTVASGLLPHGLEEHPRQRNAKMEHVISSRAGGKDVEETIVVASSAN
jgi:hypothetical protein